MSTHPVSQVVMAQNDHLEQVAEQVEEMICWAERAAENAVAHNALDAAREERRRAHLLRTAHTLLRTCRRHQ